MLNKKRTATSNRLLGQKSQAILVQHLKLEVLNKVIFATFIIIPYGIFVNYLFNFSIIPVFEKSSNSQSVDNFLGV